MGLKQSNTPEKCFEIPAFDGVSFDMNALNFWLTQNERLPFPLVRRSSSLVGSYSNPRCGNRIVLRERPAHEWSNGSDFSILFASNAATDLSRF